jgi:integrase
MRLADTKAITFDECRDAYVTANRVGWRSTKHAADWVKSLALNVSPVFGSLPVKDIDVGLVIKALQLMWTTKPETANRVRGRIEKVLDWARVRGYRNGENPARWRGHLDMLLPHRSKVQAIEHHLALPYDEIGEFMAALRERKGVTPRALEFTILTAARTSQTLGAQWAEIDFANNMWTIPAVRMKSGREHRVPLSDTALGVLEYMKKDSDYVFPGNRRSILSERALRDVLGRMGRRDITPHGFRSTFRDWAAERTDFPNHVVEMALAHAIGNKVEAAYRRGDLFERRRELMNAWAAYCG